MYLTRDRINLSFPNVLIGNLGSPAKAFEDDCRSGAEVIFIGKVRNHSQGKKVLYLEYAAYEMMAQNLIEGFIKAARQRWPIDHVQVLHRLGKVGLGEIAVLIKVESAHRDEAYQASRFLIESIKHQVPIWKKEYFTDGTNEWSLCQDAKLSGSISHDHSNG
ncbi:MAG: molybdenum cofactor biosynthesis protein MoaE [Candidatus Omnitrophica bacterium]|nr:molybdenum cofactor biosynthesis protein MoaE [Candidatus Omnitrophota bacterium]